MRQMRGLGFQDPASFGMRKRVLALALSRQSGTREIFSRDLSCDLGGVRTNDALGNEKDSCQIPARQNGEIFGAQSVWQFSNSCRPAVAGQLVEKARAFDRPVICPGQEESTRQNYTHTS